MKEQNLSTKFDVDSEVLERVHRLANTPDILGAFLMHNMTVLGGCAPGIDEGLAVRVLCTLSAMWDDVGNHAAELEGDKSDTHTIVGNLRFVVDHLGPREKRVTIGVVVLQSRPVCKSLRRLIRQIDKAFRREVGTLGEPFTNECGDEWTRGAVHGEVVCGGRVFRMTKDRRCEDKFIDLPESSWQRDDDSRSAMPFYVMEAVRRLWPQPEAVPACEFEQPSVDCA